MKNNDIYVIEINYDNEVEREKFIRTYLHGRCHIFALALHLKLNYIMEFIWDLEAEVEYIDNAGCVAIESITALAHAYCIDGDSGFIYDIRGKP